MIVKSGLDCFISDSKFQANARNNIGVLCHSASVNSNYQHIVPLLKNCLGDRLKKIFGPQHGFVTDVQDNMIETKDFHHPYFDLVIHSLYSNTRIPSDEMLADLDTIIIDLQDVGTRIYTYIYTMALTMEACAKKDINIIVLDRPNPINGEQVEGNMLLPEFTSFVGLFPLPTRHGLTLGEMALWTEEHYLKPKNLSLDLTIVAMENWQRQMDYEQTKLPWVYPSPNLPSIDSAFTFVGTVLFEGTNISEGRGTTKSLELVGHPKIEPWKMQKQLTQHLNSLKALDGICLRPCTFLPMFQKHQGTPCGGYQIHILDRKKAKLWRLSQALCQFFYHELGTEFQWKQPPYEYEYDRMPIDLINGTDALKNWVENKGNLDELLEIENKDQSKFKELRSEILLYN